MVGHQGVPPHAISHVNPGNANAGHAGSAGPSNIYSNPGGTGPPMTATVSGMSPAAVSGHAGHGGPPSHPGSVGMGGPSPSGLDRTAAMGGQTGVASRPNPSAQVQQQPEPALTSVEKMKVLTPHLKKSLHQLMRLSAEAFRREEAPQGRPAAHEIGRAMEEFFSYCDQLELHLGAALEGFNQVIQHRKYLNPEYLKFSTPPTAPPPDLAAHYRTFNLLIESQVALSSGLYEALSGCAERVAPTPGVGQAQPGTAFSGRGLAGIAAAASGSTAPPTAGT